MLQLYQVFCKKTDKLNNPLIINIFWITDIMKEVQQELVDLQIKIAYLEDLLDGLNAVVIRQDQQLQDLQDQLKLMYAHLKNEDEDISVFDLLADKPPHY